MLGCVGPGHGALGLREDEELIPVATNLPKALPESCSGERGMGCPRCPALQGPVAGAGLCRSPAWCCWRMLLLVPGPRSALALDADSRCCISKARSHPAVHAVGPGAVIRQGRELPPPAQVLPSVSLPEGSSRTPKSWSLCARGAGTSVA